MALSYNDWYVQNVGANIGRSDNTSYRAYEGYLATQPPQTPPQTGGQSGQSGQPQFAPPPVAPTGTSPPQAPVQNRTGDYAWEQLQPFFNQILNQAAANFAGGSYQYYPGSTVAPFTPTQQAAQASATDYATNQLPQQFNNLLSAQQFALGDVLSPDSNPYLRQHAEASIEPYTRALTEQILPQITDQTILNRSGEARQNVLTGQALDAYGSSVGRQLADIYNTAYGQGLQTFGQGMAFAPQTAALGLQSSQILDVIGGQQQAQNQATIDADVARYNFTQDADRMALADYMSFLRGGTGSVGRGEEGSQDSATRSAAGIGIAAFAAASSNPATAAFAPWIAAGAAALSLF